MTSLEALVDRQMLRRRLLDEERQETEAGSSGEVPSCSQVITISRQTGSGGRTLARRLAAELDFEFVDRQILDLIVANTGARERLVSSLDERARSRLEVWLDGMMTGRYLGSVEHSRWLVRSICSLAENGHAVILGRGGNFILGKETGLHVRIIAPREIRVRNLVEQVHLDRRVAERRVDELDRERREFCRREFGADIDDANGYHLVINTGLVSMEQAQCTVLAAWRRG